jgi:hypothetical protein
VIECWVGHSTAFRWFADQCDAHRWRSWVVLGFREVEFPRSDEGVTLSESRAAKDEHQRNCDQREKRYFRIPPCIVALLLSYRRSDADPLVPAAVSAEDQQLCCHYSVLMLASLMVDN